MRIAIGSDHGGYEYKEAIKDMLNKQGFNVTDFGTDTAESCDYPKFAKLVALAVASEEFDRGILICGTGIGMSITANKVKGIRAALCSDLFSAKATREHNNSNILCLGARVIDKDLALNITETWINTDFSNDERHLRRISMIE